MLYIFVCCQIEIGENIEKYVADPVQSHGGISKVSYPQYQTKHRMKETRKNCSEAMDPEITDIRGIL